MLDNMNDIVFRLTNVSVNYGFSKAIDSISFDLNRGKILGLIGANGAGKTTTIKALLGMLKINKGDVLILGEKKCYPRVCRKLGFAPEDASPPEYLTAKEYLGFLSKYKKSDAIDSEKQIGEFLDWFELDPNKAVSKYSKGMKRRLILAQAFLGSPELIILDEPLNGLDPIMIKKLRQKLKEYQNHGTSILYSSHILSEVESTCTDVAMMHRGSLIAKESVEILIKNFGGVEKAFASRVGGT